MPAGAKRGERRCGRKVGTPNKVTAELRASVAASGEEPLQYMLRIMRDPTKDDERRDRMAIAAASFLHPKLASTDVNMKAKVTQEQSVDLLDDVAQEIKAKANGSTHE